MNDTDAPTLTVAITTRNRWEQCEAAIRAIARQQYRDLELVLVDDASSTRLPETVRQCVASLGGRYFRQATNSGLAVARNTAINAARGRFIAFCDDDDFWHESMAGDLATAMLRAPRDVDLGLLLSESRERSCKTFLGPYPLLRDIMRFGLTPPVSSNVFSVEALRNVGGYRVGLSSGIDHDIWISLLRRDPKAAIIWGTSPTTSTRTTGRMTTDEQKRRLGIARSLDVWADDLVASLGEPFRAHFAYSYKLHLDMHFLRLDCQQLLLDSAIRRLVARPSLILALLRVGVLKLFGHCRTAFPRFRQADL